MSAVAKAINKALEKSRKLLLREDSSFLMKEDYKALRTNISFSFPERGPKCIAVTSAMRSEGKSTNAINLAISFAELGKKVLLIDCDLRLPIIGARLGVDTKLGLSDLLVGECSGGEVIKYSEEWGIFVICSGTIPADPTRLLSSPNMGEVIEVLKSTFDYIIMDCPPTNMVIDAAILAPYVDGYLLVVKHGETEYRDISEMLEQLKRADANILGFVYANAPTDSNKRYSRKYGGRYYQYGRAK